MQGRKKTGTFMVQYSDQLTLENQGCSRISEELLEPILLAGSLMSSSLRRDFSLEERSMGQTGSPCLIFSATLLLSVLQKGGSPVAISKIMLPRHHQSTALPEASLLSTSGGKYSKVPLLVTISSSSSWMSESPKSVSLMQPLLSIRTFSGLRLNEIGLTLCRLYSCCEDILAPRPSAWRRSDTPPQGICAFWRSVGRALRRGSTPERRRHSWCSGKCCRA